MTNHAQLRVIIFRMKEILQSIDILPSLLRAAGAKYSLVIHEWLLGRLCAGAGHTDASIKMSPRTDNVNCLAAALIAAAGFHVLFCLLSFPEVLAVDRSGILGLFIKALYIGWYGTGVVGGVAVILCACYLINLRDFQKARVAGYGALLLPVLGGTGAVTAWALLPLGISLVLLLRTQTWRAAFRSERARGDALIE